MNREVPVAFCGGLTGRCRHSTHSRFIIDSYYFAKDGVPYLLDGLTIAKKLHGMGYKKLIIYSAGFESNVKVPKYVKVISKHDLEAKKTLDKI